MNGEELTKEINDLLDQLERMLNEDSYSKKKDVVIVLIQGLNEVLYGSAIDSFIATIKNNRKIFESDYKKIKPLLKKWKRSKWKKLFGKYKYIDPELFNDFKGNLKKFSQQHPYFFNEDKNEEPISTLDVFLQKIWQPHFQKFEQRANLLESRLSINLKSKDNKYKIFIDSQYELMQPFEFEEFIAKLFTEMGYSADVTPKTGDFGIDVIAKKGQDIVAIQAKKYSVGNKVGNRAVQRLIGSMSYKDYKANKGILITTSNFTNQAYNQAEGNPVYLWNQKYLNKMVEKHLMDSND